MHRSSLSAACRMRAAASDVKTPKIADATPRKPCHYRGRCLAQREGLARSRSRQVGVHFRALLLVGHLEICRPSSSKRAADMHAAASQVDRSVGSRKTILSSADLGERLSVFPKFSTCCCALPTAETGTRCNCRSCKSRILVIGKQSAASMSQTFLRTVLAAASSMRSALRKSSRSAAPKPAA